MTILYVIAILVLLGIFGYIYYVYIRDTRIVRIKENKIITFKPSMELSNLPIITFYQGDKNYNFLLDTGSNISYVNAKSNISVSPTGVKDTYMGSSGVDESCERAGIVLYRNETRYEHIVNVADLSRAFGKLKKEYGILVTGILGNDFFTKYKYCLDFKELVAYQR